MAENRRPWWISAPLVGAMAGALAGLALPPLGWPPLLGLALVPLWSQGPWAGGLWGLVAVLVSHRWLLGLHPLDWIGVPLPLSLPLCWLLLLLIALLGGLLVAGWRGLMERLGPERWSTALLGAALWGLAEVLLAKGPLFWIGLGAAALPGDRALAGLARFAGAGGLAAVQLLLGWGLWRVLASLLAGRRGWRRALAGWLAAVTALHLLGWGLLQPGEASGAALPRMRLREPGSPALAAGLDQARAAQPGLPLPPVPLLVVQPAIPTREKFSALQQERLLGRLAAAQREASQRQAEAVLLPEGALALGQALPLQAPVEVLSGGFRQQGVEQRSALLRFPPEALAPAGWLDKHRLVPLGEWVPLGGLLRWSGLSAVGGVSPGSASRLLSRPAGPIGVAICYEISDGSALAAASRDGARWLLASANLDPYPLLLQRQFAALAQLRAIEAGRWLVSSANTGPSLVVDAAGAVRQQLPAGRPATALLRVQPLVGLTPYARLGELPLLLLALVGGLLRWRWRP